MPSLILLNIKILAGTHGRTEAIRGGELSILPCIANAYLIIEDGAIADFGSMDQIRGKGIPSRTIDVQGQIVLPAWCDSHTHLVYAGSREEEFVDKIKGLSYSDIAEKGGGILNSAKKMAAATEDQLFQDAWARLQEAAALGTASVEIKSGYGLTVDGELKMLRVIKKLKEKSSLNIRSTFLGAHAYPKEYQHDHQAYIRQIMEEMLPVIAHEKLADYIDVFCEKGFFSNEETEQVCKAGIRHGLKPKIHANQLSASGAVQTGVHLNARSVDHLETMNEAAIASLAQSKTIGTLLPSAAFFLGQPYQPARDLIERDCAVALASDCNPGSSPGLNMNFIVSLACIGMKMLPAEALNAATFNGACAMDMQHITGSIAIGKRADLIVTRRVPSIAYLPYSFSSNLIDNIFIKGESIH